MTKPNLNEIEQKWKNYWEKENIYKADLSKKNIFSIDTPPPTVSGDMHIGHAFSYSQQDFIARFKRMYEGTVFYPFGTDDNGLPTEKLIEKTKNIKSKELSRSEFIKICQSTLKEITPRFIDQWKSLGISADYKTYYSTIDKETQKISQKFFIDLYNKNLVYKKSFPTIWDVKFQTSVAQAELEDMEKETFFTTIKFITKEKELLIATTRPELLGSCVAIFVNPKDKRYKNLVGKTAKVPLFNHEVPIIEDESADMEKGTGILMICSYGDKYDVDAIMRHKLNPKISFNKDGTLNENGGKYKGLEIKEARKQILEDLKKSNLITDQKKIKHVVNVYEKSGEEIEFIPTEEWFIKIIDKKDYFIKQGKKINWHPQHMFKRYENWINGLEWDWNISRERHFGIPIPVWYCTNCKKTIIADIDELPIDPVETKKICNKCNKKLVPEKKVLDTWATSSITPQIASNLIDNKIDVPFSLRPNAHDIIRTWAFYTIVRSLYHKNSLPWKDIIISGIVSLKGQKMSKSKGNVIDPKEKIELYGADALRYWAATSKLGEDLDYQEQDLVAGKRFINKILNATNFTFLNLNYQKSMPELLETDKLLLNELNKTITSATESFKEYNYSKAKLDIESFFWKTLCDNYLEIVKHRVYNGSEKEKASAYYTLYHALLTVNKLMAPITPFITEEIYQNHFREFEKKKSIHLENWPENFKVKADEKTWNKMIEIISLVRSEKSSEKKSMTSEIILTITKEDYKLLNSVLNDLKSVTKAKEIKEGKFKVEFV